MPEQSASDVFLSYASVDRARALALADALESDGVKVWIDRTSIAGGSSWSAEIVKGIEGCAVLIVLCSPAAMQSPNVTRELQLAMEARRPLLPLLLEPAEQPPEIRYILAGRQWVEVLDRPETAWLPRVREALARFGVAGTPAPAPESPASSPSVAPPNLPQVLTSFVGREQEIAEITRLLGATRLLTLSGPGGVGKTRLALETARAVAPHFADGVIFVGLTPLSDPALVVARIAQTLGVHEQGGPGLAETLQAFLHGKDMLLVLDNFEQVVESAPAVAELVASSRYVQALVTSRVVLRVQGEQEFAVPPLMGPEPGGHLPPEALLRFPSVRLFAERAARVSPGFAVTAQNAAAISGICHRLDGLPLAIELAAARTKVLPPQAVLARLQNRLTLLTGGARDLPPRQQTLRAAIDWSYDLLEPAEQRLFHRLAVFVGGWTLEAAEAICVLPDRAAVDVLDGLASLVDNSLVLREEQPGGEPRFFMLETIREYALERLAESGEEHLIRPLQAAYYLALAAEARMHLAGAEQLPWLTRLEAEHDNLRAVWRWWEETGAFDQIVRLSELLELFFVFRGHLAEGRTRLEAALRATATSPPSAFRAAAFYTAGGLAFHQLDFAGALELFKTSLAIYTALGNDEGRAFIMQVIGAASSAMGDHSVARVHLEESIRLHRALGDGRGEARSMNDLANVAHEQGNFAEARVLYERSLALYRGLDAPVQIGYVLNNMAVVAQDQGDVAGARELLAEAVALQRELSERRGLAVSLAGLARLETAQAAYDRAEPLLAEVLRIHQDLGDRAGIAFALDRFAILAAAQHQGKRGLMLAGAAAAVRERAGIAPSASARVQVEQQLAPARQSLGEAASGAAWAAGRALTLDEAIAVALAPTRPL